MSSTSADMPDRWLFLPIKEGNVRLGSFFGLAETTSVAAPLSAPMVLESWLSAAEGDASGFWFIAFLADLAFPEAFVWGETAAVAMLDAEVADDYYSAGGDPGSILRNAGTEWLYGGGGLTGAWPDSPDNDEYRLVQTSDIETLLIGGTVDFPTPAENATNDLLPSLPNGHQVVHAEFGHSTDFWTYQPEASTRLINTFFDTGEVDDSLYSYRTMDFGTTITQTGLGKGFVIVMLGFRGPYRGGPVVDAAPGQEEGQLRTQNERLDPVTVSTRSGLGGMVPSRVNRDDDLAIGLFQQRPGSCSHDGYTDRVGDLLGLGSSRLDHPDQASGTRGGHGGRSHRCVDRVHLDSRTVGAHHHDRRSSHRNEPSPHRPRHQMGSVRSRSILRNRLGLHDGSRQRAACDR